MLRQDELAFLKAIFPFQVSPVLLKELRLAMARRKKRPAVPAGRRSTPSGSGKSASQQLAGKQKAKELPSSGDSMQPANRRPAPGAGSLALLANPALTGEQAASGSRQHGTSEDGATYAAVLSGSVAPSRPSGTLKPKAMDPNSSETGVSMETSERIMPPEMSGLLSGTPDGNTDQPHVAKACLPAGKLPNKKFFYCRCEWHQ